MSGVKCFYEITAESNKLSPRRLVQLLYVVNRYNYVRRLKTSLRFACS